MSRQLIQIVAFAFGLALGCSAASARDGDLITSFGTAGVERLQFNGGIPTTIGTSAQGLFAIAVQPDGKIVINASAQSTSTNVDFGVFRLNANGTRDTNFGTGAGGDVIIPFDLGGTNEDLGGSVALDAIGNILVGGTVAGEPTQHGSDCGIARLTPAGVLDTTFSGDGKATVGFDLGPAGQQNDTCIRLIDTSDNKIVISGAAQTGVLSGTNAPTRRFAVARLLSNGSRDTSFNSTGRASIDFGADYPLCLAYSVAEQSAHRLLLVGYAGTSAGVPLGALARLNNDGSLDSSFGNGGTALFGNAVLGYSAVELTDVASLPDDSFVAVGIAVPSSLQNSDVLIAKFTANGSVDTTFGSNGYTIVPFDFGGGLNDAAISVRIDSVGRVVVGGYVQTTASDFTASIIRLLADGTLDQTFGTLGSITFYTSASGVTPDTDQTSGIAFTPDGALLAVSAADDSAGHVGLAKFVIDTVFSSGFETVSD